ncbi:MAG: sensor domain-containing diguanylate cyclase [Gammaproteobacteria bacterium]|nr:sensor domain-containing diguanylate cyclase [Gammaproteobacteria bacterium]
MFNPFKSFVGKKTKNHWDFSFLSSEAFIDFLDLIPEAAILSTESGDIILTNKAAQTLFEYSKTEFLQIGIEDLVPKQIRAIHPKLRASFLNNPEPRFLDSRKLELSACKKNGSEFPMESALFAVQTNQGPIAVNLLRDISGQKNDVKKITEYAFFDTLTNLPNRRYFDDNLHRAASKARRDHKALGLLYIDLDGFKPINDNHGHDIGDLVLHEVSDRLIKLIRAEDLLARVGGDEFILTVFPVSNPQFLDTMANRILQALNEPIVLDSNSFQLSASIGISFNQSHPFDEQKLVKLADEAMYQAKKQGGNCFVYAKPAN